MTCKFQNLGRTVGSRVIIIVLTLLPLGGCFESESPLIDSSDSVTPIPEGRYFYEEKGQPQGSILITHDGVFTKQATIEGNGRAKINKFLMCGLGGDYYDLRDRLLQMCNLSSLQSEGSYSHKIRSSGICNRTVTTALREACGKGSLDALKKLKPDPRLDNLSELLEAAAVSDSKELIDYLLHLGAQPNDKPNGGSSALDRCLWHLPWEDRNTFTSKQLASKYALAGGFARIERLLEAGAQWRPSDPDGGMKSVRQMLCKCEPAVTVTLIKLFATYRAASEEVLEELLETPRMRGHLSIMGMKLSNGRNDESRVLGPGFAI